MSDTPIHPHHSRRRRVLIIGAAVALAAMLSLVAVSYATNSLYDAGTTVEDVAPTLTYPMAPSDGDPLPPRRSGIQSSGEQLAYDSYLRLQTKDPSSTMERASQMVRDRGGSVTHLTIRRGDEESASAQFSIPSDRATETLNDLRAMGVTARQQLTANDLGPSIQGVQDRIQKSQAEVERLTRQLAEADPSVKASYEEQLRRENQKLTALQARLTSVQQEVTFTSVSVQMVTKPVEISGGMDSLTYAAAKGWSATLAGDGVLLAVTAFLLPVAVALTLLVLLAAFTWRVLRRGWGVAKPLFR